MPNEIVTDLLDMFADTVIYEPRLTTDGKGKATYDVANPVTIRAMVYGKVMQVRDPNGHVVKSTVQAILAGHNNVSVLGRFTLPARFAPTQPKALAVDKFSDENGAHHETVYF